MRTVFGVICGDVGFSATDMLVRAVFGVKVICCDVVFSVIGMLVRALAVFGVNVICGDVVFCVVGSATWLVLIGDVGGIGNCEVMTMSGGQMLSSFQKVISATCTQSEPGEGKNRRLITCTETLAGKHNLTRELQEVMVLSTLIVNTGVFSSVTSIVFTPIPHGGQLNIITSILSTL